VNEARYNDFVPMVYGTAWYNPPIVFARNDGNLTRNGSAARQWARCRPCFKGAGERRRDSGGRRRAQYDGHGMVQRADTGYRAWARLDSDFTDGDPYGSMAYASVVVTEPAERRDEPAESRGAGDGAESCRFMGPTASGWPKQLTGEPGVDRSGYAAARRMGAGEIDAASFARAAAFCDEEIAALDLFGTRYTAAGSDATWCCRSDGSGGRGPRLRNSARLLLTYGSAGQDRARMENAMARSVR